jgi:hypothetical protein
MLLILCLASLGGASLASARPPVPVTHLSASDAKARRIAVPVARHRVLGGDVAAASLAASVGGSAAPSGTRQTSRLLATAADGTVALAETSSDLSPDLLLARPDGSQDRVGLPGILGAAFAPSGWLAAVDSAGRLWRIAASSGLVEMLAEGPFGASLAFTRDGALLLVEVSSAEAPYASRLVRFDPDARQSRIVLDDPGFVFSASELGDGSVAAVVHPFGGGVAVVAAIPAGQHRVGDLPASAIEATLDTAGRTAVFALADDGIYLQDLASGARRRLGDGQRPRISADGTSILALRGSRTDLLARDGSVLASFATPAVGWTACGEGCRP